MAPTTEPSPSLAEPSSDTALCLIPPEHLWEPVDRLRSLHDKAYNRWPPHINLVYPFVHPEYLQEAAQILSQLDLSTIVRNDDERRGEEVSQAKIILDEADAFTHKQYSTIHLRPGRSSDSEGTLARLAKSVRDALGQSADEQFRPHMTIAQSYDPLSASHSFLMDKVRTVTGLSWDITELAILVRDRGQDADSPTQGSMRVWGYISIDTRQVRQLPVPTCLYPQPEEATTTAAQSVPQTAYHYSSSEGKWVPLGEPQAAGTQSATTSIDRLIVASYNVLGEFHWPPNQERYPNLIEHIVSDRGGADILVLEEVTDHFLQYLLSDERVRSRYTYATHAPSNQTDIGPLPNHLNIVVLSRFELQWHHLPFQRKHKGAAVVTFPSLQGPDAGQDGANELPLVLAACHLTHGLVEGAIVCKKNEITRLLGHLSTHYSSHPQIIAGDFNMPTSSYTMDMARKTRHISIEYYRYLRDFDSTLASAGFQDTWLASRIQSGESSSSTFLQDASVEFYEGEQGATFDPLSNSLAAKLVGNGLNNRPQRYDRILVNGRLRLRPGRFNMFGLEPVEGVAGQYAGGSDHWGIRCLLTAQQQDQHINRSSHTYIRTIQLQKAPTSLSGHDELKHFLSERDLLPTENDIAERHAVINLLRRALQGHLEGDANTDGSKGPQLVLAVVGSFSLGVWTRTSDLDIISIGDIGQKTFIRLAVTRLRKAAGHGITILGKIKALSGTMLQLEVNGIKVDLHYCAATRLLEQ
jgi:2'-5' RNA ligase/endonuclease/exonuclease/phosphatase family metal-dependent hydrolase